MKHKKEDDEKETNSDCDQDSDTSFTNDTDEEADTAATEEVWIDYIRRSTAAAVEQMKNAKNTCWVEMHRKMKWNLAVRSATMKNERWAKKAAEWKPGLSDKIKTQPMVGRQNWR